MTALRDLVTALGSAHLDCRQDGAAFDTSRREFYTFGSSIAGIEDSDALLLVGVNPRRLSPVINARIRKRFLAGPYPIAAIGSAGVDLTYDVLALGDDLARLDALAPDDGGFGAVLVAAKKPMVVVGEAALARPDGAAVLAASWRLAERFGALDADWNGFNVLHGAAARVGALDLGFMPGEGGLDAGGMVAGGVDVLWLLGADEFETHAIPASTFVVYQGSHGDRGAARADVILPGVAWTEKAGTYVNTEGRVQRAFRASDPPGEAREDWRILRAFGDAVGVRLPYDTIDALRARMEAINPVFGREGLPRFGITDRTGPAASGVALSSVPVSAAVENYWLTNPISRASQVMHECQAVMHSPFGEAPIVAEAAE